LISRATDLLQAGVVSVTRIQGGHTTNVISADVELAGTVRAFREGVRSELEVGLRRMAESIAAAHGVTADLSYERRYRATVNSELQVQHWPSWSKRWGHRRCVEILLPAWGRRTSVEP
jgi:metal-dependent amidase/aminoacylase/carboxypeptidase family protein